MPAGTLQNLADYTRSGYWVDTGRTARSFLVDGTGQGNGGEIRYNIAGWSGDVDGLTPARETLAREAFKIYEEVLGINFVETSATDTSVDLFLRDNASGAGHTGTMYSGTGGNIDVAVINVDVNWEGGDSDLTGYEFRTFMHEIGHGLGLGHQGNYDGSAVYPDDATFLNDSWQLSMMSYFDQTENPWSGASFAQLVSPMAADFLALDNIYSGQGYGTSNAFGGDTIWGVGTNISSTVSAAYADLANLADEVAFCIVDGGGIDTIDFSGFSANQNITIKPAVATSQVGMLSNVGGLIGNMTLAVGTTIENITAGSGNDILTGNGSANLLICGDGNDTASAGKSNDIIRGGIGNDILNGEEASDTLDGGLGKDTISGSVGNDFFDFNAIAESVIGANRDTVSTFDGAGATVGDLFDFLDLGDLNFGGTDIGSINCTNTGSNTLVSLYSNATAGADMEVLITDGAVTASAYTAADFMFV